MITIALPKKFSSKDFVTTFEVTKIRRSSGKLNKLKYLNPNTLYEIRRGGWGVWDIAIQIREIDYMKKNLNRPVYQ